MLTRGSEWRRWDLHVHTPETILNDQFNGWESYLDAIEAHDTVKVMGVTDYMSIANYSKLKGYKADGRISNIELLIPNIEFRIAPPSDRATAINIHILVSPNDPNHEREVLNALGRLDWEYRGHRYSCVPDQLSALGRAFDQNIVDDRAALAMGVTQFKVDFTKFRDWYVKEKWLQHNSLIAVAAGDDGLSGFQRDGAWGGFREEITRFSEVLFSGRPGERDFWIGRGSDLDRETMVRLGGPKPVVQGSDAHRLADLFNPALDRFCWLKADLTFDGMQQILYEPEDRVFIGPTPPLYHDEARVIVAVKLSDSNGWFDDVTIPLNAGLVSIIGQKGSGKSALAELIAYAAGSWHENDKTNFLSRAGEHLEGLTIQLEWADGSTTSTTLWQNDSENNDVRYLSQRFVERLCADDHIGAELVREIEAVIFSYIDPTDTLNASNFEELRTIRTEGIRSEGERLREDIQRLIQEECELRDGRAKLSEKKTRVKALAKEREGLVKQTPKAATPAEALLQKQLQDRRTELAAAQQVVATEKQKIQKITDIRTRMVNVKGQIVRFNTEIDTMLTDAGIADKAAFHLQFASDAEPILIRRATEIQGLVAKHEGAAENPAKGTIRWLEQQIKALVDRDTADKAQQQRIKVIQGRISAIDTEAKRLEAEIAKIEGPDRERLKAAGDERLAAYVAYFENLKNEQTTLEELYAPVKAKLKDGTAKPQEQELEFSIRWEVDIANWLQRGGALFDQRTTIPYGTMQGLGDAARKSLLPAWASGDTRKIADALTAFLTEFRKGDIRPVDYLRSGITLSDVLNWLYEVDHIRLTYGLKYNGVELEKLSPGTKGIVLLILYLGMDVGDTRPLIVDQPDENLDNESIYALLTTYFKSAKKRRQIILITHNPNLVVNGDSEQVIVAVAQRRADGLPHITYVAGAIENSGTDGQGIRQQVCRILEGGTDAFLKREKRYAIAYAK